VAVLTFLRKTVQVMFEEFSSRITDNFRVIENHRIFGF
jgi:hypothetical protein